jgi:hypothetical protein
MVHDPTHIFFKLPRPVDHPVESAEANSPHSVRSASSRRSFFWGLTSGSDINTALPLPVFSTLTIPKVRISGAFFTRCTVLSGCLAYLRNVIHVNIFCDLCMDPIRGQWFHCVYCPRDLCGHCEEVDEHDRTHFSMVAKAPVRPR